MQTFLAYPDFREAARVLDPSRLGNQFYREGLTLMRGKWANHPASKMWRGHELYLCSYLLSCGLELSDRGYKYPKHIAEVHDFMEGLPVTQPQPAWLGDPEFHSVHRAVLLDKDPDWYGQFGWEEQPAQKVDGSYPYIWPMGVAA